MKLYRIKDWNTRYENNRTRELKRLDWVPIPNAQDGEGYTLTATQKNGAELLGAWLVILQVASRCGTRGTLLRDTAVPHDPASLSRLTRISESSIKHALEWFSSRDMQWIQVSEIEDEEKSECDDCETPAGECDNPASGCLEGKGREENGIEEKAAAPALPFASPEFAAAWYDFTKHRTEIKKKLTPTAVKHIFADFTKWGEARAIAAICHTIGKGWQGIREPDGSGSTSQKQMNWAK